MNSAVIEVQPDKRCVYEELLNAISRSTSVNFVAALDGSAAGEVRERFRFLVRGIDERELNVEEVGVRLKAELDTLSIDALKVRPLQCTDAWSIELKNLEISGQLEKCLAAKGIESLLDVIEVATSLTPTSRFRPRHFGPWKYIELNILMKKFGYVRGPGDQYCFTPDA